MQTSLQFYGDKLGFEVIALPRIQMNESIGCCSSSMASHDVETQYELRKRPPVPDVARRAGHSDTTIYFGCPDVDATYEHLRAQGVEVKAPKITQYGFKAIWLSDPDGYGLCFHWPAK